MQGILAIADHAIEPNRLLVFGTVLRQYVLLAGRIIGDERNRPSERIRWIESEHKTFVVEASIVLILDEIAIQMVTFTNASGLRHRLIHTRQSVSPVPFEAGYPLEPVREPFRSGAGLPHHLANIAQQDKRIVASLRRVLTELVFYTVVDVVGFVYYDCVHVFSGKKRR